MLLYILGAIVKKTEIGINYKKYQIILGIVVLYIITYLNKIYGLNISIPDINKTTYVSYISPTILGISILYVIYFSKININKIFVKLISFAVPSAFAIYLINDNYLVRKHLISNLFVDIANNSILEIFIIIMVFSLLFVVGSILVDKIRILLFKIFNVNEKINRFTNLLNKTLNKLIRWL